MTETFDQLLAGKLLGTKSLKLSCNLTTFPEEIFTLADTIEILDLSCNKLSKLPDNFYELKNLKILFLSENEFTEFPKVLSKSMELDIIGFKANHITTITEGVFPKKLRWLILTNNHILQLPASIGECSLLQKLMLSGNKLKSLPEEMSQCKNLELLRIAANNIEALPDWLFSLPKLSWLAFAGNPCSAHSRSSNISSLDWENLIIKEKLGEGASGSIYKAELSKSENKNVALKIFKAGVTSDGFPEDEMSVTTNVGKHPNLVKIVSKIKNHPEKKQGLVLELIPGHYKNLGKPPNFQTCTRDTYEDNRYFSLKEIIQILLDVSSAMTHIHSRQISHGDLYAHNILINTIEPHTLFSDFGAATFYESNQFFSEEIERIEVRAFGCLVEDLLERIEPKEKNNTNREKLILLKENCFDIKIRNRPSFAQILSIIKEIEIEF